MAAQSSFAQPARATNEEPTVEAVELLELLGDEYTRRVLDAVIASPQCGTAIVETTDMSKATVYRRLNELEAAGLIGSQMVFDPDGHHHEQFHAVVESVDITFGAEGLSVAVETESTETTYRTPPVETD